MMWIVPLAFVVVGVAVLVLLAARAAHEAEATEQTMRLFGRTVRPALLRVRDETTRTRARRTP